MWAPALWALPQLATVYVLFGCLRLVHLLQNSGHRLAQVPVVSAGIAALVASLGVPASSDLPERLARNLHCNRLIYSQKLAGVTSIV